MKNPKQDHFAWKHAGLILFFSGALFQLTYIRYGINMLDGGLLLASAERSLSGEVSMVDFFGYPPGKSVYVALFFKIFGKSIVSARISMVMLSSVTIALLFYLSRPLIPRPFSVVPSILLLGAPGGYHCRFITFFTVLNLLFILRYVTKDSGRNLFIASFAASFTTLFRLDISLFALSTLLVVFIQNNLKRSAAGTRAWSVSGEAFRGAGYFFLGAGIPFMFICGYTLSHGAFLKHLPEHIIGMANFNKEVVIVTPPDPLDAFRPGSVHRKRLFFEGLVFYYPFFLYAAALFYAVKKMMSRKIDPCFGVIFFFGAETLLYPLSFPDFWHAITIYPLVFVLTTYLFSRIITTRESDAGKELFFMKALFFSFASIFFIITTTSYGIVLGSIGVIKGEHVFLDTPGAGIYLPADRHETYKSIISFITENSREGDGLFVVPHEAAWYFLCGRKNPTRFDYLLPGHISGKVQLEIIGDLKKSPPKFIIYQDISLMGKESTRLKNFAGLINEFVRGNYTPVISYGEYQILERSVSL